MYCVPDAGGRRRGRGGMRRCAEREEGIPEANSMPCFTNVPGASPAFMYVSNLTLLKVQFCGSCGVL